MRLVPGNKLGGYEIVSPLGSGGMGEVWKAHDTNLGRLVAIKILNDRQGGDALKRLKQEARTAAQLNQPYWTAKSGSRHLSALWAAQRALPEYRWSFLGLKPNVIVDGT